MRYMVAALLVMSVSGCGGPLGLNFERSSYRSAGDLSATATLEFAQPAHVEPQRAEIKKYAKSMLEFIETGQVAKLPIGELEKALKKLVPAEFAFLVDGVIGYIASKEIDVSGAIGANNVKRIKAGLIGILRGADAYDIKDRES